MLNEPMQTKLLSMLSHVGHMRDPRASSDMVPDEVWASLPPDPEVVELERRRTALKGGKYRVKSSPYEREVWPLTATIASRLARWKKTVKQLYRRYYFHNRPTWDLLQQANGEGPVEHDKPTAPRARRPGRASLPPTRRPKPRRASPALHQGRHMHGQSGSIKGAGQPGIEQRVMRALPRRLRHSRLPCQPCREPRR